MAPADLILRLDKITYGYSGSQPVLDSLDLTLRRGEKIGLVGYNGSGKTTLLHVIMGLRRPQGGTLEIFGGQVASDRDYRQVRQRTGLLFQDADDQLFSPTVLEDLCFGPLNQGKSVAAAEAIARSVLTDLELNGLEDRVTHKLSGGEKKLVALGTILAMNPELMLLDEPTTGLDEATKARIAHLLRRLDLAYVVISHDYEFLAGVTERVYLLRDGRLILDERAAVHSHYHIHSFGSYPHQHDGEHLAPEDGPASDP